MSFLDCLAVCFVVGVLLACVSSLVDRWRRSHKFLKRIQIIGTKPVEVTTQDLTQMLGRATRGLLPAENDWLKLTKDKLYRVKILPASPLYKDQHWYMVRRQHYLGGEGSNAKRATFVCLKRALPGGRWEGQCPLCDHFDELWKLLGRIENSVHYSQGGRSAYGVLKDRADMFKPRLRYYYQVVDAEDRSRVRLISLSEQVHGELMSYINDCDYLGFITEPNSWVKIRIDGVCRPRYQIFPMSAKKPENHVSPEQMNEWLNKTFDFNGMARSWERRHEVLQAAIADCEQGKDVFDLYRRMKWPYNRRHHDSIEVVLKGPPDGAAHVHHPKPTATRASHLGG